MRRAKLLYLVATSHGKWVRIVDEVILSLKYWAYLAITSAAIAVIGCGGSGTKSSTSTTSGATGSGPGTTSGRAVSATVNIPNENLGLVYVSFLTGSGRVPGDLYMNMENVAIYDSYDKIQATRSDFSPLKLHLDAFTLQYAAIDVSTPGVNSYNFDQYIFNPYTFAIEQANNFVGLNPGDTGVFNPDPAPNQANFPGYAPLPTNIPCRLTVFPGRDETLPVFLDDTMFSQSTATTYAFNYPQFAAVNLQPTTDPTTNQKLVGFLADYLQIDLSHMPVGSLPSLMVSGKTATHWYLSGDNYAMSDDPNASTPGNFEQLTLDPSNPLDGYVAQPGQGNVSQSGFGGFPSLNFPGTYDLRQANPSDITGVSKITSLYGRWRSLPSLVNLQNTTFDIIVFPNSAESYTFNQPTDVIAIVHNGADPTQITNMYVGYAYYTGGSGSMTAAANLFPLKSFVTGSTTGIITYDLGSFTGVSGTPTNNEPSIRNGSFSLDAHSAKPPAGFANSGTFLVFR